ncbi:MAG: serine hydrolase domain-containing protein [Thermodesulfobacteriota bacterium]
MRRVIMLACILVLIACQVAAQAPGQLPPAVDWQAAGLMKGSPPPEAKQVTKANWLSYPFIRWSFQHSREVLPTKPVDRGPKPTALPTELKELDKLAFDDDKGKPTTIEAFLRDTYTDGIVVLHKGKIVYERYLNGMTPDTRHMLFSTSKSFVGLVAAMLVSKGVLDENAPVSKYVPELAASAYSDATVRQVLDMRVGAKFSEVYTDPKSDIFKYVIAADWVPRPPNYQGPTNLYATLAALTERDGPHGGPFGYKSANSDVLGWVASRATGKSLSELVSEMIWSKIGAEHKGFYLVDPLGTEVAMGGLNVTLRDLSRLGQTMLQMGQWEGREVVPKSVVEDIMKGGDRDAFAKSNQPTRQGWSYRSQWWITHNPNGAYLAMGVFGQRLYIDPKAQMVVAKFGSHPVPGNALTDPIHMKAFDALAKALTK